MKRQTNEQVDAENSVVSEMGSQSCVDPPMPALQIINGLSAAIYTCNRLGEITYFNDAAARLWGRSPELGKDLWCGSWKIYHTDGTPMELDECPMALALRKGIETNTEIIVQCPDGEKKYIQPHPQILYDESGNISGAVNMLLDITEQKEQEISLKESENRYRKTVDSLEKIVIENKELEQYAYIASHDLQEPLRKIQTFASILRKDLDDKTLISTNIEKITASARRMSQLISDVLDYSRLSRREPKFVLTDLKTVLDNVQQDLELLIEEKSALIVVGELPSVMGIPVQLHQLFYNLMTNSLKFNEDRPEIVITSDIIQGDSNGTHSSDLVCITFSDNGIGFESQYTEQIFNPFQRLNERGKYAGTGLGLALCKRIAEKHQGTITAEGELSKGAIFRICLPVSRPLKKK